MMNELEAILDGDLVSMVFLYGSAVMLVASFLILLAINLLQRWSERRTRGY